MVLNRSVFRSFCGVVVVGLLAVGCASADGEQGPAGADGGQGPAGADGEQGPAGPAGSKGDTGSAGSKGDTGDAGPAGANGTADGSACTSAGGVVGTTVSGFDSSGLFSSYCVASPVATVTTFVAAASFREPNGVVFGGDGNLYVLDSANHTIRKVTPAGEVTTFAGSGSSGSDDGTGTAASFNYPRGVAVDGDGNLYVADTYNSTIRKVTPAGVVTTFAGSGSYGSDDGTGTAASFADPRGVAFGGDGNLYVADTNNHSIRKVTPAGVVTTLAGSGSSGSDDGTGTAAGFGEVMGAAFDGDGNLYVADAGNNTIRKITPAGEVTTLAGSAGSSGSINGIGPAARFSSPRGVAVDGDGNLYVTDTYNSKIRKVTPAG